jgi:hypothetical protein
VLLTVRHQARSLDLFAVATNHDGIESQIGASANGRIFAEYPRSNDGSLLLGQQVTVATGMDERCEWRLVHRDMRSVTRLLPAADDAGTHRHDGRR